MKKNKIQQNKITKCSLSSAVVFLTILFTSFILINDALAQEANSQETDSIKYLNLEREIINQLNQERSENNLHPLIFSPELRRAAEIKVKDLIENKYFLHTSPNGEKAWDILGDVGYDYKYAGENLAMKFKDAVSVHNAWMKSKSHKENILFENYTEVAVAIDERAGGSLVAVEFFGKPAASNTIIKVGMTSEEEKNEDNNSIQVIAHVGGNNKDKYEGGTGNLLTQVVPDKKVPAEKMSAGSIMPAGLSPDQVMSLNNMILLVAGVVCLVLVVNIWVLEKEDERILAEAKKLCNAKETLANA
jgi:uncharacterized protein YkwD